MTGSLCAFAVRWPVQALLLRTLHDFLLHLLQQLLILGRPELQEAHRPPPPLLVLPPPLGDHELRLVHRALLGAGSSFQGGGETVGGAF